MSNAVQNRIGDPTSKRSSVKGVGAETLARLLLLEEQAHVARVIRHNLERCHYELQTAASLDEALQMMTTHRYDALIVSSEQLASDLVILYQLAAKRLNPLVDAQGRCKPLILISCGRENGIHEGLPGLERMTHPVSLKAILRRLDRTFARVGDPQAA